MTQTGRFTINFSGPKAKEELHFGFSELNTAKSANYAVTFDKPFPHPPAVLVGVSGFTNGTKGIEFAAEPANITTSGFDLRITVSAANGLVKVTYNWLATDA